MPFGLRAIIATSAFLLLGGETLLASITYTGSLPRNFRTEGSFELTIEIRNLLESDLHQLQNDPLSRLDLFLPQTQNAYALPIGDEADDRNVGFYIASWQEPYFEQNSQLNYDLFLYIAVYERTRTFDEIIGDDKFVTVRADYRIPDKTLQGREKNLEISFAVANQAPHGLSAKGIYRGARLTWLADDVIEYKGGNPAPPVGVNIIAIDMTLDSLRLPMLHYRPAEGGSEPIEDQEGEFCYFDASLVDSAESCIICDENEDGQTDNYYFDMQRLPREGVFVSTASRDRVTIDRTGLEIDREYAFVASYQPSGLVRSACVKAAPIINTTWSELNGDSKATATDKACFIASSAYGSAEHADVEALRRFRDAYLDSHAAGRWFVKRYYEYSPTWAAWLDARPALKPYVRWVLFPTVQLAKWLAQ